MDNTTAKHKQTKTYIRKLIPYAALGLTLIAISRQIQILRTQAALTKPVSYFRNISQNKDCHIAKESILGHYEKGNGKTLIIILDAYPSDSLYKILTGKHSKLHEFLKKKSSVRREDYTPYPYTMYSLAYLLGDVRHPGPDCHYPFFGKNDKPPRQLIGNPYIQSNKQFCKEDEATSAMPMLVEVVEKTKNQSKRCTLLLSKFKDKLAKFIEADNAFSRGSNVEIIHDTGYHEIMVKPIDGKCQEKEGKGAKINLINQLENGDACYVASIKTLLDSQIKAKVYDRIIVMSDHGPRISIPLLQTEAILNLSLAAEEVKPAKLGNKGSLVDRNYYQFFSYGINITSKARGGGECEYPKILQIRIDMGSKRERIYRDC